MLSTPPRYDEILPPGSDAARRLIHGLKSGSAKAVELHAGHTLIPSRHLSGGLRNVAALLAHRAHTAKHHIIDACRIQPMTFLHFAQQAGGQMNRLDLVQGAVFFALAARCADGIEYQRDISHLGIRLLS